MALVLDTGVLLAALDGDDPAHAACQELIAATDAQLIIPAMVLVELDYWIRKRSTVDVWLAFAEEIEAGAYVLYPLDPALLMAAAQLEVRYADLPLGLVDASVIATCETLGEEKVATLDRRHFGVVRTATGKALRILPEV